MLPVSSWIVQMTIIIVVFVFYLWKYSVRNFDYWKKRGVYCPKPIPFLGNLAEVVFLRKCIADWTSSLYFSTKERFFGVYMFDEPSLMLKDPELIQYVMIKDSNYFPDRHTAEPQDEVMSNFMFLQKSPVWKSDRTKLTPVFTSGKLKTMFSLIYNVGEDMVKYLDNNLGKIEAKDIFARYSTNVIATCAFGIDAYSFDNHESDFRRHGRLMLEFSFRNAFSQMSYFFRKNWVKIFRINFFPSITTEYFCQVFTQTMKSREMGNTRVNDFVDLLIDLKNSDQLPEKTAINRVCGQAIMFFAAGFETTSSSISFTLHELCLNTEIQNKVRAEILQTIKTHGGVTYEAVQDMKYLKNCVLETLRKYPVLPYLDRTCIADYNLPGTDLVIQKGMSVCVPLAGLHMDEKYFPDPRRYNPDRFSEKNYNQHGLYYMPFGEGPRKCIGERFAFLSTQLALIHILTKFEVHRCAETPDPIEYEVKTILNLSKVGLPMILKRVTAE